MKKFLLKILPYVASITVGAILFFISGNLVGDLKVLFLSLSASFWSIPLIYLFYNLTKKISHKKLNKEVFDYAKVKIDTEMLSILNKLLKIVYPYKYHDFSFSGINNFLSLDQKQIENMLSEYNYIGFQIFKRWDFSENKFNDILENPYILNKLEDNQIIAIIQIIKSLRSLELLHKEESIYENNLEEVSNHKIISGKELNENNTEHPERLVLLKNIQDNNFLVQDFGDFKNKNKDNLLKLFSVKDKHLETYSKAIFHVVTKINKWVEVSGNEFIIDSKMFKINSEKPKKKSHIV
ncbi:hypothetical protein HSACCH_01477 [Halanaerobium saccharolyticum subsp. saccharolyticum DSM 6643]|uniref:Uncharacterized protein n=1 Tax=Halanaerobium saccharolyticum subsp. saccharolyticum DSM 6643 TaxID=1293054 RepID=M5E248_9FIRM|nr:hypothetical protein [Halanaerobium saccharolyticum]CCU79640.1 hypothetical protein HSACCH_01477 [Halanaerobium saccharolyticum subsp. saccharolyticum DSM 6643]